MAQLVAIETWRDALGTLAKIKGYPDVTLRIKHIHGDVTSDQWIIDDMRCGYNPTRGQPATCVCELVSGTPPAAWGEPCTPFGHYRIAAKDLLLEGEN